MKKKMFTLFIIACSLFLVACSKKKADKTYDEQFMSSLSKGLEDRWDYNFKIADKEDSKTLFQTAIDKELTQIKKYRDLKFKDSELKELALSYVNHLEKTKEITATFGADSFYENWDKQYKVRTEKLIDINNHRKIKVSQKYRPQLEELLSSGKEVKQDNERNKKLENLVTTIQFTKNEEKSDDYYSTYEATVENTSGAEIKSLSATIKLLDENGVVVDNQYLNAGNWSKNEKRIFDFSTDKTFTKTDIVIDYTEFKD